MMKRRLIIFWAYFSEIAISTIVFAFLNWILPYNELKSFIEKCAPDLITFSEVILAGSIAFLWAFYSKSDTLFAGWLYDKGAYIIYLIAYVYTVGVFSLLTVTLIMIKHLNIKFLSHFTLWLLLLSVINLYTFIKNVFDQLSLNMEFNRQERMKQKAKD